MIRATLVLSIYLFLACEVGTDSSRFYVKSQDWAFLCNQSDIIERMDRVEAESEEKYQRLAGELDRDLTWIAIVVAVFSLFSGVVVPIIINSEYKKYFERETQNNRDSFNESLNKVNNKLSDFSKEYSDFKRDYQISSLMENALNTDDKNEKIRLFTKILSLNPNHKTALLRRGIAYRDIKSYPESIMDFQRLISLNPKSVPAYSNLGLTYYVAGDNERAKNNYNNALSINPAYSPVLFRLSKVLYAEGNHQAALEFINRAVLEKTDTLVYHQLKRSILEGIVPQNEAAIKKEIAIIKRIREDK